MESRASSKSNLSESSSWDFDTMCQNTAKLDEMMLSMKQGENVSCKVCNKRKDTLARREEIAWQREEIIHTREKELREWELMLEEKSRVLNEKEKKLKCDEGKVLQIESVYNSEKNSRKSSLSEVGLGTSTLEQCTKGLKRNEEREKLLQEKEKIVFEKIENMVKMEQSIALKEQHLNNQRIVFHKETEMLAQKNHSLDLREEVIKKVEEAVDRKLNRVIEEKKFLDERNIVLTQKENALATAVEYVENKERSLNERENMIIEKERNILQQISDMVKLAGTEPPDKNKESIDKFDEIFDDKWKSIQERENSVVNSEQILLQKWKEYAEAKELFKSEEESLQAVRDTFEKEKNILREWEKLLEKREKVMEGKCVFITGNIDNDRSFFVDESVKTWPSSLNVETKTDLNMNRSSPFGAVGQILNGDINLKSAAESVDLSTEIPDSANREISGDELFQFYEKGKESFRALLLKENADTSTNPGESSNSENNHVLTETVKAFFNKTLNVSSSVGTTGVQAVPVPEPEINGKTIQLLSDVHGEINKGETLFDEVNNADAINSQNKCSVYSENQFTEESGSGSSKRSIILPMIYKETDETSNEELSGAEIDTAVKIIDKNDYKVSEMFEARDKNDSTTQNSTDSQNTQEGGSVPQDSSVDSSQIEKKKTVNESCMKNGNDLHKSREVSYTRVSPAFSTCSSRSLTSPISGRGSPLSGKKRKPPREALLEAISKRDFLETVQLLDTNCMSLEVRNKEGRSAALLAVECGNIELVERLMNKGADIKACDYKGYSALHIAVTENNSEMVLFLLKKGLNPLVTDINGNSSVKLASDLQFLTLSDVMNKHITAQKA